MFDFAWSEIALIAAVALIAIGPKDMPAAIRGITNMIKKARRMAAEFQTHVDEMVRDANLDEVRNQFNEIRNFDIKGQIERAVDEDGSLRSTFATNPLDPTIPAAASLMKEVDVSDLVFEKPAEESGSGPVPGADQAAEIAIDVNNPGPNNPRNRANRASENDARHTRPTASHRRNVATTGSTA